MRHCEERSDEAIQSLICGPWIASRSLSSGAHSRDPLARNDAKPYDPFSPDITGPKRSQVSPLKRIICNCSSGAKSVGLVLMRVPGR